MPVEKILFPTKFRELSFDSLETLLVLKKAGLREVILLHVISREEVGFVPFGGYLKKEEEKRRQEATIRFEDWQKTLSENGIDAHIKIVVGEPVYEILKNAENERVDLIVVGRKKRIEGGAFVGSYTHKIITRSKVPTLVSKYMVQFQWDDAMLTKTNDRLFEVPLVTVDWTERTQRLLGFLMSLKGIVRKAFIFYNFTVDSSKDKTEVARVKAESSARLEKYCEKLRSSGIEAEAHLGSGGMLDEMIRVSRERKASMIMIGNTSEERFLKNMLDRSLSYQVAKLSELPTLLVP
ncbi:MAG TPA: universal stress protein [Nitrospirae bacterium]|nr:universal stress protein family protein [bacterium BMS3Abin10]GBE38504.1 universal stress protein family protein [bacterium BMS3Bbin08]HDH01369.1 universal stress protein [Nitrospirota bacterium]HDH51176.1 universal stress protein [Nitrospirota bacterium]HDK82015.1 universal stress protein [Nitrospirota bacterium]